MKMLLMWLIINTLAFLCMQHPLSMGLTLLIQTILIAMITGLMNYNYWFSYIIFLIMVGGMLILFIYMTSVASNEIFKFSKILFMILFMSLTIMMILLLTDNFFTEYMIKTIETLQLSELQLMNNSMNKFMNWPSLTIMYLMIIYLLMTLIVVVKITNISHGPLRQNL